MPENKISRLRLSVVGALCGMMNGIFGSGGGLVAVPSLQKCGFEVKKAHASSLALTGTFSVISAITYYMNGYADFGMAFRYIPGGIAGAIVGALLMKRISPAMLKKVFGVILIISGVRIIL